MNITVASASALPTLRWEPCRRLSIGVLLLWMVVATTIVQAQPAANQQPRRYASAETVARLPQPKVSPGEIPRPCADSPRNMKRLEFASSSAQMRWKNDPALFGSMQLWAEKYFRMGRSDYLCHDLPFVVQKFQEAAGDTPTGQLSDRDLDRIESALSGTATTAGADALRRHDTSALAVRSLPKPSFAPGELPRPCVVETRAPRKALADGLRYSSDDVRSVMVGFPTATLLDWVKTHFRYADDACIEWDYAIRKFQEATGAEVTGVVSRADHERLSQGMEQGRQLRRETTTATADVRRSVVDFLPQASTDPRQTCSARAMPLMQQMRLRIEQRVMALPPQARRSAVTERVAQEVKSELMPVAPQWAEYWSSRPLLREWAIRNGCNADLHFMIEHWQLANNEIADARDPQGITRTENRLQAAVAEHAKYNGEQDKRFASESAASGETGKARIWSLDEISGRSRLTELMSKVPLALCTVGSDSVVCAGKVDPCTAERRANGSAGRGAVERQAELDRDLAAVALRRCESRSAFSAAANSRILFAGLQVSKAQLVFDDKGLATMQFAVEGEAEPGRNLLTRRHGKVETQQEVRNVVQNILVPGQTVYVPGQGTGYAAPSVVQAPTSYTVTRYIWATPDARIEESQGSFIFRFLR